MKLETPELAVNEQVILRPINQKDSPRGDESISRRPRFGKGCSPLAKRRKRHVAKLPDLMIDLELHRNGDSIHFWAIHSMEDNSFVGMIGLGDELQLAASAYNLGYWVKKSWRNRGITEILCRCNL